MKPRVAFLCVHNSCRSQIAEALGKEFAAEVYESYSAGTETKPQINPDAVRLVKTRYGIDMEKEQYSKLTTELPEIDIVVTMGCNVVCPFVPNVHQEDWGLDDPSGESDAVFHATIDRIHEKVLDLKRRIEKGEIRLHEKKGFRPFGFSRS